MFANYTYVNKNGLLLAGLIVMLLICYQFSIKHTIGEYRRYKELLTNYYRNRGCQSY